MIFYSYCSRYFLLTKITTPLAYNLRLIGDSAYKIVHSQYFNPILIDYNQAIVLSVDCIAPKLGKSPAFSSISEKRMLPSRSITNDARFETPFIL
jgi:hypothetical protein